MRIPSPNGSSSAPAEVSTKSYANVPDAAATEQSAAIDDFVSSTIQQYRQKLLDLSSRNPLVSFRHSERSRSHIRVIDEIPETLFSRLSMSKQMTFDPLPYPELIPPDERVPLFDRAIQNARHTDQPYRDRLVEFGPNPSDRQMQKAERELRNRVRVQLGLTPYEPTLDPKKRAGELGIPFDYDLPVPTEKVAKRHNDSKIQTLFFREDLDRKLSALRESARILLQDAGLSALYCAFGFLEYYDSEATDQKRVAPLVFYPIELNRELDRGEYHYFIQGRNDEVEINVALRELLRKQYGVELPDWVADEDNDANTLASYLSKIEQIARNRQDWALRRFVTVGLFTFSTLAMYKDLDPEIWPEPSPLNRKIILRSLIAGAEVRGSGSAPDYDIDDSALPEALLITDADSSQHSAVIDVLTGKNIVVQGPPGTGKSQTITNIIAAALDAGKSVLFVAEKMAALEVVQKRLTAAGLNPFCLELHSSKTSKSAVVQSLAVRLEHRDSPLRQGVVTSNLSALREARADLIYYVQKSNEAGGETGLSVREILLGSATRDRFRAILPPALASARLRNSLQINHHMRREMLDAAENLERQSEPLKKFGSLAGHPWRGLQNSEITDLEIDQLVTNLTLWQRSLSNIVATAQELERTIGGHLPTSAQGLTELSSRLEALPFPPANLISSLFPKLKSSEVRLRVQQLLQTLTNFVQSFDKLTTYVDEPEAALKVESDEIRRAYDILRSLGLTAGTIGAAREVMTGWRTLTTNIQNCESISTMLTVGFGLESADVGGVRAACTGIEQLLSLPKDLWRNRAANILAEDNISVFCEASEKCAALKSRRKNLQTRWNLGLLPPSAEIKQLVIALKTRSWVSAIFDSQCRRARGLAKAAAAAAPPSKSTLADELLHCAQYLDDEQLFLSDQRVRQACGAIHAGLDTDFGQILAISEWAQAVREQLARYGEDGARVLAILFEGGPDKLRELSGLSTSGSYQSLSEVLATLANNSGTLAQARERLLSKCEQLERTLETMTCTRVRESLPLSGVEPLAALVAHIEWQISEINTFAQRLDLRVEWSHDVRVWMNDIIATVDYANTITEATLPSSLEQYIFTDAAHVLRLRPWLSGFSKTQQLSEESCRAAVSLAKIDPALWCGEAVVEACDLSRLIERCHFALSHPEALHDYTNFLLAEEAAADAGIGPVLVAFSEAGEDYRELIAATEFVFYRSSAEQLLENDPRLRHHSGTGHEHLRKQYQRLDREYLALRRQLLANKLCARAIPDGNSIGRVGDLTELALVQRVSSQTRPRISLRELFRRAGKAVQALAPCWMMSPMSVAQFLEPGRLEFDLLLMDEASQIRPEEALGAIARATQVVIVGDQMQLPPTSFFQKLSTDTTDDEEEMEDVKQESVLEAAAARFFPPRRLKWHYRSEHGSLIAFSNQEFYNNDLTVFPSPYHEHPEYGVHLSQVNGVYTAGTNQEEAQAVVSAALKFMDSCPNQSLGIVAVNSKQAELIREQMDHLFASEPSAEAYRARWETELDSLFVKNLENVQGDERDVIFISTVYGKDGNGNFYQRFGPINGLYGHRRLNVLFTRAKKRVVVFSSMTPEDIQDEGKHWGVKVLKAYLQYARDGHFMPGVARTGDACDSEFEEWVLQTLRTNGFEAVTQFGFAGYRIDIAVRHPKKPGTFLCGVECDGATYHSARSVRERDRLRQEVLERLGWKIYRIWSTDWFRNPALQTKNLLEYLNKVALM
jgi:very-short-patch-repair endonuclease